MWPGFVRHQESLGTRVPADPSPPPPLSSIGYHGPFPRPTGLRRRLEFKFTPYRPARARFPGVKVFVFAHNLSPLGP